ncbi:porin [Achromobacter xylosoxidans]|uniref:porin n=1 Tax=Alcaligenes xylosoxydans xylosoxydans TaxID=85698 RepID=UPI0003D640D6|nr:porin [Achromobacter xylosoxidans]AHC49611.1 outer membrane porin [Achromobacter xylosoxidans NBRC 15126 = ATCC 27061]QKQ53857.1 porin [Achromobacter xylosoxidans]QPR96994.1 porin [Achromobacter xylosoxidans]UON40939.1 porin [Achromobacter xylosoxidans]CKI11506.1 Outer membrane porin protein BP0840 precursor [Achromobacter xylosoxidans]
MKKTLLAAAMLATFAGAAQAETSVTLYGIIDTGIGYNKVSGTSSIMDETGATRDVDFGGSRIGMINGVQAGSRWGLKGSEDLGDGLRAMFTVESGFDSGDGTQQQNRLFNRQATVGLANDAWGSVEFGRQTTVGGTFLAEIDPFYTSFTQANIGTTFSAANTMRWDNMIMYRSPWTDGFQFALGYSFNVDTTDKNQSGFRTADNARGITAGLRYVNGPLNVSLTYDQLNSSNQARDLASNGRERIINGHPVEFDHDLTPRQYALAVSYDLEVVKLAAAYARTTNGWFVMQDLPVGSLNEDYGSYSYIDGFKANSYMLGATLPLGGASSLFGSWQHLASTDSDDPKMNVWSVGYTYDLSKRTSVYAYGSYGKNYALVEGLKSTAGGVGVRHLF